MKLYVCPKKRRTKRIKDVSRYDSFFFTREKKVDNIRTKQFILGDRSNLVLSSETGEHLRSPS